MVFDPMNDAVVTIHEEEVRLLEWVAIALREPTTAQETADARRALDTVIRKLRERIERTNRRTP